MKKFEIERKFLIKKPKEELLNLLEGIEIAHIIQTYTSSGVRLRKWSSAGQTKYIKTVKTHITDLTRIEEESEISEAEYSSLLNGAESSLEKVRYRYPFEGKLIEIDVFPFWSHQAFLEVELEKETEVFLLPDFIEIIREVTEDKAYRNYSLSKKIPKEEKF